MKLLQSLLIMFLLVGVHNVSHSRGDDTGHLQAGTAVVDISPVTLPALQSGGFVKAMRDRIDDPLYARCLVISDEQVTIALVIVDTCIFSTALCDEIKQLAAEQVPIPTNRMMISATHTHAAPCAMSYCLGCPADEPYLEYVPAQVARAIVKAHQNLQPAKFGWAAVDGSEFTNCRRWITRSDRMGTDPFGNQTVRAMMHPGYQNPNYVSPAGPIDPWLSLLSVVAAEDDTPLCILANLSMHYFSGHGGFSADYYGEVTRLLEAEIETISGKEASGFVGIMSQGTSGDLHWMDYSQPQRSINQHQYSQAVADRVLSAWKTIEHQDSLPLAMAEKRLTIERRLPSAERLEWARAINEKRGDVSPRNQVEVYAEQAQWIHDNPTAEVVLQAIRIGGLGMTAMANEVYGISGLKLKRQSPLGTTINFELANGGEGYIPPPEQHRLGGYTTWPARTAGLIEEAEPIIVKTVLELLESVSGKPSKPLLDPPSAWSDAILDKQPVAYWRLADMYVTQATDALGKHHAAYQGGIALFLPGPCGPGLAAGEYGNRCVYLGGGYLEADIPELTDDYTISLWFWNGLPPDARDVTGALLSTGGETLLIGGKAQGEQAGRLVCRSGSRSAAGSRLIATKAWHQLTLTRTKQQMSVYLDGDLELQVEAQAAASPGKLWIGHDGGSGITLDGKVDEVAVFDRALTSDEVAGLYDLSGMTPPPQPKPVTVLDRKPTDANALKKYADAVMASKPRAYWRLHDRSGSEAKDLLGQLAATYEPGSGPLAAGAVQPNFSGGRLKAHIPALGNTYSVEMWVRNDLSHDSQPVTAYLFSRATEGIDGAAGDNLGIGGTHSNSGQLFVYNGNDQARLLAGLTRLSVGSWSHVVFVRKGQNVEVYLNGGPNPEGSGYLPIAFPTDCQDLLFGGRADGFANLQGMLEEIAVYDDALTPAEIKVHFDAAGVDRKEVSAVARAN